MPEVFPFKLGYDASRDLFTRFVVNHRDFLKRNNQNWHWEECRIEIIGPQTVIFRLYEREREDDGYGFRHRRGDQEVETIHHTYFKRSTLAEHIERRKVEMAISEFEEREERRRREQRKANIKAIYQELFGEELEITERVNRKLVA